MEKLKRGRPAKRQGWHNKHRNRREQKTMETPNTDNVFTMTRKQREAHKETLTKELVRQQELQVRILQELKAHRRDDFPGRVKTNEVIKKEQAEAECQAAIDRLQKQIIYI